MRRAGGLPPYELVRSDRKTLAVQVKPDGRVIVRAPRRTSLRRIESFVLAHADWIGRTQARLKERQTGAVLLDPEEHRECAARAKEVIPARAAFYAEKIGVAYGRITIRSQRTRWGSCSAKGNLNFNCLLMLAPPEVLDSVIVHELCHRKEMNHSARFYEEVRRVFPDYDRWHGWLKQNGGALLARLPG